MFATVLLIIAGLLLVLIFRDTKGDDLYDQWDRAEEIANAIAPPVFPDNTFYLIDFGGVGDGLTDNKPAFDSIINHCGKSGGGNIVVGPGTYLINGPVHPGSNIHLHLEAGSVLVFSSDPEFYLPVVLTSWEGTRLYNYSPFIYARNEVNIAITGQGQISGNASGSWVKWQRIQRSDQLLLRKMNHENIPLEERKFGKDHFLRPHLIQFYECKNILIDGIEITDSPFWCVHFVFSGNIIARNLRFNARNLNNDGIDIESSENVLIENIEFDNKDDNIAVKSGRDLEGRLLNRPSRNIVIRDCRFKGHNAVAIGSEMSGGVNKIYIEDCGYAGKVVNGIYFKGNLDRGGVVRDIYIRNLAFDTTESAIMIDSHYKGEGYGYPPAFRSIYIENVSCNVALKYGISLIGSAELHLDSIFIKNIVIDEAQIPVSTENVYELHFDKIRINGIDFSRTDF